MRIFLVSPEFQLSGSCFSQTAVCEVYSVPLLLQSPRLPGAVGANQLPGGL